MLRLRKTCWLVCSFVVTVVPSSVLAGAANLKDLQRDISKYMSTPAVVARLEVENTRIDQLCSNQKGSAPAGFVRKLKGGAELRNFEEILPGVRRFGFPTPEALEQSHAEGLCDRFITLNKECLLARFDRDQSGTLSDEEKRTAKEKLEHLSMPEKTIVSLIGYYAQNGKVCLSTLRNDWHINVPSEAPEKTISLIFEALEIVLKSRKENRTACFHCALGKHRTGLVAFLLQAADLPRISEETLRPLYEQYFQHVWFDGCMTRIQTLEIVPMILESKPFADFRARWRRSLKR